EWVATEIVVDLARSGLHRGEYAVLYRNHEMGARIEQALIARGVPCRLGKGHALLDDPVISQLITSLRIVLSPDSDLDMEALARKVLPEQMALQLQSQSGVTFLDH